MTVTDAAEPFDIEDALTTVAQLRRRRDPGSVTTIRIADLTVDYMRSKFGPEAHETVGLAFVWAAATLGALVTEIDDMPPAALLNVLAFTGQRLTTDARLADNRAGLSCP
jgi:hypothetical protein